MEGHELLTKYRPKSLGEFLGSKRIIEQVSQFLCGGKEACMLIIGPSGCGKTTLLDLLFKEHGYQDVFRPVYDDYGSHKEFEEDIESYMATKTILEVFKKTKKLVFFDNVETLLSQDRYANTYLQELVNKIPPGIKVLFTSSSTDEKKITDIKKRCPFFRMDTPRPEEVFEYIGTILAKEDYDFDDKELMDMITGLRGNIRNIMLNIFSDLDPSQEALERAYFDMNIFDTVSHILVNTRYGFADLAVALSSDPTLVSFMMYDNYKAFLADNYVVTPALMSRHVPYVSSVYMKTAILEDHAYKTNDWNLIESANFIRCGSIRAVQHMLDAKRGFELDHKTVYTQITTRAAQHHNNIKKIMHSTERKILSYKNMMYIAEVCFEKRQNKKAFGNDESLILQTYQNNVCSRTHNTRAPLIVFPCRGTWV